MRPALLLVVLLVAACDRGTPPRPADPVAPKTPLSAPAPADPKPLPHGS